MRVVAMTYDCTENDATIALALALNCGVDSTVSQSQATEAAFLPSTLSYNDLGNGSDDALPIIRATDVVLEIEQPEEKIEEGIPATLAPLADALTWQLPPRPPGIGELPAGYETGQDRFELLAELVSKYAQKGAHLRADMLSRKARAFVDGKIEVLFQT